MAEPIWFHVGDEVVVNFPGNYQHGRQGTIVRLCRQDATTDRDPTCARQDAPAYAQVLFGREGTSPGWTTPVTLTHLAHAGAPTPAAPDPITVTATTNSIGLPTYLLTIVTQEPIAYREFLYRLGQIYWRHVGEEEWHDLAWRPVRELVVAAIQARVAGAAVTVYPTNGEARAAFLRALDGVEE